MRKGRAGKEKTGRSGAGGVKEKPHTKAETVTWTEIRVGKRPERVPRKAAIV